MKKKITLAAVPLLAATVIGVGIYGVSTVQAEEDTTSSCIGRSPVTAEERAEHRVEREAQFEEKMTEAIENGELTQEQREAIEAKHEELRAKRDEVRAQDLDGTERRDAMHEIRNEMKSWIKEQGLEDTMPEQENGKRGGQFGPRS